MEMRYEFTRWIPKIIVKSFLHFIMHNRTPCEPALSSCSYRISNLFLIMTPKTTTASQKWNVNQKIQNGAAESLRCRSSVSFSSLPTETAFKYLSPEMKLCNSWDKLHYALLFLHFSKRCLGPHIIGHSVSNVLVKLWCPCRLLIRAEC